MRIFVVSNLEYVLGTILGKKNRWIDIKIGRIILEDLRTILFYFSNRNIILLKVFEGNLKMRIFVIRSFLIQSIFFKIKHGTT